MRQKLQAHLIGMRGEAVACPALGEDAVVIINMRGIDETLHWSADPIKMKALFALKAILRTAQSVRWEKNFKPNEKAHIRAYGHLANQLKIAGRDVLVDVVIEQKIDQDGFFYFDLLIPKTATAMSQVIAATIQHWPR